ncbi:c-type cytochrome [Halomonas sp. H5]|uniref:c-type cytochrome n=1 Tax=Halomonas sp. H5 TaxID=3423910 RepID=UPI003D35E7A8
MHKTTVMAPFRRRASRVTPPVLTGALLLTLSSLASGEEREPTEVFRQICAHCHATAEAVGPATVMLAIPEGGQEAWGNYMRGIVRNGRAAMPAFRHSEISDAELDALITALMSGDFAASEE